MLLKVFFLFPNSENLTVTDVDFTIEPPGLKRKVTDIMLIQSRPLKRKIDAYADSADHNEATLWSLIDGGFGISGEGWKKSQNLISGGGVELKCPGWKIFEKLISGETSIRDQRVNLDDIQSVNFF